MNHWQICLALGLFCLSTTILAVPRFGRRHGPPLGPPPEIEKYLPKESRDKLKAIEADHSLKFEEKKKMIDEVFDSLPAEILEKLPSPPGFDKLPEDVQNKLKAIRNDRSLKWSEKMEKVREIIESLPEEQRRLLPPPPPPHFGPKDMFRGVPPMPPPGFKDVLPEDVYNQLVAIHQNKDLSESDKKSKIDETLSKVPKETLAKLPLPPGFDQLPEDVQQKARAILADFSIGFDERHKKLFEFLKTLPEEQRRLVRPPPPFGGFGPFGPGRKHRRGYPRMPPPEFKDILPAEIYAKLEEIHQKKNISCKDRHTEIDAIMSQVPKETLDKLPLPPHLRGLPEDVQKKVKEIINNFEIPHSERREKIRELIDDLPEEIRSKMPPPPPIGIFGPHGGFPMGPPPDLKEYLPAETWEKLVAIHANRGLSRSERMKQIDEIMNSLPNETLLKLPLPPHLSKLPVEAQEQLHKIVADKTKTFEEKRKAEKEFVKSLPIEQQKLVRPPPPPGFENLPEDIKSKIDSVFENQDLDDEERFEKIGEIIESLPEEIRNKLPLPPPPFQQ